MGNIKTALLILNLIDEYSCYSYDYKTCIFESGGLKLLVDNSTYQKCIEFYNKINK